ncbi:electron transfer flavoprotein subunit beta [Flavobacteriaceae bacterium UJ101]|nr:electron transfer flavoprotein subunit beta [Flavobacteriaceae bacterium UJ101]
MKILVCISSVPDTTSKINFTTDGKEFDKNGIQFIINPMDEFSLTKAIFLQASAGATVTVLGVGDASIEPVLRKALAIGANDAIRVNGTAIDSNFVAAQIAKVVKEGAYDLVLTGKESLDYNGGVIPAMVAAHTDYNFINACVGLEVDGTNVTADRDLDGSRESVSFTLPAVVAGQKGIVEEKDLKIPNMRGIMQARSKPLNVVEPTDASASLTVVGYEKPVAKSAVKMVSPDNLDELVTLLREDAQAF